MEGRTWGRWFIVACCIAVLTAIFAGCSSSSDDDDADETPTTNQVLPTELMVPMPDSLGNGDSPSSALRSVRAYDAGKAADYYNRINDDMMVIKSGAENMGMFSVLLDYMIYQNGFTPSPTPHTNVPVTLTEDLMDRIIEFYKKNNIKYDEAEFKSYLGQTQTFDSVTYDTIADGDYDVSVSFTMAGWTYAFAWSTDKAKVRYSSYGSNLTDSPDVAYLDNEYAYDDSLKGAAFLIYQENVDGTVYNIVMKLRTDADSTKKGVYVGEAFVLNGVPTDPTGYADDDGGALKESTSGTQCAFDADGKLSDNSGGTSPYTAKANAAAAQLAGIPDPDPILP